MGTRFAKMALACFVTTFVGAVAQAGDSGCGLGSVIIQKNSKLLQLFSMTTNHFFLTQPFGITSGTSGCSSSGLVMNEKAIDYYAEANQADLTREIAQGGGEKLATLASLHGCSDDGKKEFAEVAQRSMPKIMPEATTPAREMVRNLQRELIADERTASHCAELVAQR